MRALWKAMNWLGLVMTEIVTASCCGVSYECSCRRPPEARVRLAPPSRSGRVQSLDKITFLSSG